MVVGVSGEAERADRGDGGAPRPRASTVGVSSAERLEALERTGLIRSGVTHQFDRLTELASSLIGAPVALISMVDDERQWFVSESGLSEPVASERSTPLSQSLCRIVVDSGDALVIDDLAADGSLAGHPARRDLSVEAYCGVPIRDAEGHVLGSFCAIDDRRRTWDRRAVKILEALARVVGDAVSTSVDYSALLGDLQSRLLPTQLDQPPVGHLEARYRAVHEAEAVGGDFYDTYRRADGSVDLILGDAVGHGVGSTHAAAQLRAAARAVFTGRSQSPSQIINRMSESCADLPGCLCAALLVAHFPADGSAVTWARAGALPPIVTGRHARVLDEGGSPPLGVGRCEKDAVHEIELFEGDGLLFFTDGLAERRGEEVDVGLARIADASRDASDLDELIDRACPAHEQHDDIAVVSWSRDSVV
ncbi:PP2C family protein-serine/threonine phosphatase [Ilumatobacter sp.]|uniref:PP2C family protein-serine/threonine phosphatase n=1 Tax=Ilumatobacter sp. TaxID=1967498 RepID=UPI003B529990